MKRFLLSVALLLACSGVAFAQESEFSGGGGGGVSTAGGSGTAGVIPAFVSASSLEDSKMTTSGTNKGTWTLYDSTAVTGVTSLVVRAGAAGDAWATKLIDIRNNANTSTGGFVANGGTVSVWADDFRDPGSTIFDLNGSAYDALSMRSSFDLLWSSGAMSTGTGDVGISRSAAGILKITDGSTGQGGIGIADSATNTVSDALILRHQGGAVNGNGFGTGLVWQGENDGGVMHPMASIDAVWSLDDDTNEQSQFKFSTYDVGGELPILTLYKSGGETKLDAPYNMDLISGNILALYGATQLTFVTNAANKWIIPSTGAFYPATTNTYDIGTSSALVKDSYLGTSIQGTRTKTLTDNTITDVVQISSATTDRVTAGHVSYTVYASDATNHLVQTETGEVPFLLVNENGTVTVTLGTVYGTAIDSAGGAALTNTFASSVSGTDAKIRVTSNYDQATLTGTVTHTIEYRVYIDSGTATVTPQ